MTAINFIRGTTAELHSMPITDGYIYLTTDTGKLYIDGPTERYTFGDSKVYTDTETNWNAQRDLIGEKDALYVYTDIDSTQPPRLKIGDGKAFLIDAPFVSDGGKLEEHINDKIVHITNEERLFWNNKVSCYLNANDSEQLIFTTK